MLSYNSVYQLFSDMPVAINNYYGDPTVQWDNTIRKVQRLNRDQHQGPVAILTRGYISLQKAKELREAGQHLKNMILIVSISGLPKSIEPVEEEPRYLTIKNAVACQIPVMTCLRPIIPSLNGTREIMEPIFRKVSDAGCKHIVVSGFRGNDDIIENVTPEEKHVWVQRVKLMFPEMAKLLQELADTYNIELSKRVSCGVTRTLGHSTSYNPYYYSPELAGCAACPIAATCGPRTSPKPGAVEVLKNLGYKIRLLNEKSDKTLCSVRPNNRLNCPSCCTCCFMLPNQQLYVDNDNITLGDLTFIRFLTGVMAVKHDVTDNSRNSGEVNFPNLKTYRPVHTVNSWYVLSRNVEKCYACSYCIVQAYDVDNREFGLFPSELAQLVHQRMLPIIATA